MTEIEKQQLQDAIAAGVCAGLWKFFWSGLAISVTVALVILGLFFMIMNAFG